MGSKQSKQWARNPLTVGVEFRLEAVPVSH